MNPALDVKKKGDPGFACKAKTVMGMPHSPKADQHGGQGTGDQQECEEGGPGVEAGPQGTDPAHQAQQQGTIEQAPAVALGQNPEATGP